MPQTLISRWFVLLVIVVEPDGTLLVDEFDAGAFDVGAASWWLEQRHALGEPQPETAEELVAEHREHLHPLDRILGEPEEVTFFARSAIYGIGAAAIYWFMTSEAVGTVLLGALGVASGLLALILGKRAGRTAVPIETPKSPIGRNITRNAYVSQDAAPVP